MNSTSNKYEIVSYRTEFCDQLVELQKLLWSPSIEVNHAYFRWKYEHNPFIGQRYAFLALHRKEVVGFVGFYGSAWEIGSPASPFPVLCSGDLVIDPAHRRGGLFHKLIRKGLEALARDGIKYTLTMSAAPLTFLMCRSMGWRSITPLESMRRFVGRDEVDGSRSVFPPLRPKPIERASGKRVPVIVSDRARPEEMAELVDTLPGDGRVRQCRDEHFFGWRFGSPVSRYRFLFAGGSRLRGYMVLQESKWRDHGKIAIVDWEGDDQEVRSALLEKALDWARPNYLSIWSSPLDDWARRTLRSKQFEIMDQSVNPVMGYRPALLLRPVDEPSTDRWAFAGQDLLDITNWDLRMLYSDGY